MSLLWVVAAGKDREPEDEGATNERRVKPMYGSHFDLGDCWNCDTHGDVEVFHDDRPARCANCGSTNVEIP